MRLIVVENSDETTLSQSQITHLLLSIILKVLRLPQHPRTLPYTNLTIESQFSNDDFLDEFSESDFRSEGDGKIDYATDGALRIWSGEGRDGEEFVGARGEPDESGLGPGISENVEGLMD